ncbi:carbohydrate sulfotransferase 10-like isoform X2 [Stigmatopora nigra]
MRFLWRVVSCGWLLLILLMIGRFFSLRNTTEIDFIIPHISHNETMNGTNWQMMIDQRSHILTTACKNKKYWGITHVSKLPLDHIFVSDQHKVLFCQTSEMGDNEWYKLIGPSGGFPNVNGNSDKPVHDQVKDNLRQLSSLTSQEITDRLENYFKFLIVRNPLERLISVFEDKFLFTKPSEPWYKYTISTAIIRKYRKGFPYLSNTGLLFNEFVRYVGDTEGRQSIDWLVGPHISHWATYVDLCAPCDIHYDFVSHFETLAQDVNYILSRAGNENQVSFPSISPGLVHQNKTKVQRYFSGTSKWENRGIYERYQGDFAIFGYPVPEFLLN